MRKKGDGSAAEEFPSQVELRAASALLLLSSGILSFSSDHQKNQTLTLIDDLTKKKAESVESKLNASLKDSSCLTSDSSSEARVAAERLKLISAAGAGAAKSFRRSRSKIIHRSSKFTPTTISWGESIQYTREPEADVITTEASCSSHYSGGPSEISSSQSHRKSHREKRYKRRGYYEIVTEEEQQKKKKKQLTAADSSNILRRAEAILAFLSGGCSSELRIRQVLGDSPDTSKALRMLLKLDEIRRRGAGGRSDPFIYEISLRTVETVVC